jgi:outer membrane usher protein
VKAATLATAAVLLLSAQAASASGSEPQVLSLVLNGHATGLVGEFARCDLEICATAAQLRALGFIVPAELAAGSELIPIAALPGILVTVDEAKQVIEVTADDAALRPNEVGFVEPFTPLAPLSPSGYGMVLNHDVIGTFSHGHGNVGALLNMRLFSPHGIVESEVVGNVPTSGKSASFVRLNTTYTRADSERLRRLRIGDVITGTLPWSRAVRLGGIQLSSDFNLRPDLVTYPLPRISSSTAVPATVDLIVNGVRQSSEALRPGPFAVQVLPVITGAGVVSIAVQDELGRQTLITLPFYASNALLAPELTSYSVDVGMIRKNFGSRDDHYSGWAGTGSVRRGISDWLTLGAHGEASGGLGVLGGGITARIGTFGIATVALAGSARQGEADDEPLYGGLLAAGFQRITRRFSISFNGAYSTVGYRDIAAAGDLSWPKATLNVGASYQFERWGVLGTSFVARDSYCLPQDFGTVNPTFGPLAPTRFRIANVSYSVPASPRGKLYVNGYRDFSGRGGYGVTVGFNVLLDGRTSTSVSASRDSGGTTRSASVFRSAIEPNDVGYRLQAYEGNLSRQIMEVEYLSPWSRLSGGLEHNSDQVVGRVGMRGALTLFDGKLFASDHVEDSFASVRTGEVGGVPVLYENRLIGVTDKSGRLLAPSLLSYQNNRLALETARLPPDIEVGQTFAVVRPPDGSGIVVDFHVEKVQGALVTLHDAQSRPVPLSSSVQVAGEAAQPVGYDGEVYLKRLQPTNRLVVTQPDGSICIAHLEYIAVIGDIPLIGPVPCL